MYKSLQYCLTIFLSFIILITACYAYSSESFNSNTETSKNKNSFEDDSDDVFQVKKFLAKAQNCFGLYRITCLLKTSFYYKHNAFSEYYISLPIKPPIFSA